MFSDVLTLDWTPLPRAPYQRSVSGDRVGSVGFPTATTAVSSVSLVEEHGPYLLVLQGEAARVFVLPKEGEVVIGRSNRAELHIEDPTASRRHATIAVKAGAVILTDLGSQNGTLLNGQKLNGSRELSSGDEVAIGELTLLYQAGRLLNATPARRLLDARSLLVRASEEIERALAYGRPLAIAFISLGSAPGRELDPAYLELRISKALRGIDVAGLLEPDELVVLIPELHREAARELSLDLHATLKPIAPALRMGLVTCPEDGCEARTLIAVARAAAAVASGAVGEPHDAESRVAIGDRTILVADPAMARLYALIRRLAGAQLPVLITGETGVGKENAAFAIHAWSPRASERFVAVNCGALPDTLVESELFGYEKGAFSGATAAKIGLLEAANGGTVFLDEVGELPLPVQAKLLRALDTKRLMRLGDTRERPVNLRIVAATNRNLEEEVRDGNFRQDLFFRLSAATVVLPPLRERPREIPILCRAFVAEAAERAGRPAIPIAAPVMQRLASYSWPGNVRELKNVVDYAVAAAPEDATSIELWHLPDRVLGKATPAATGTTEPEARAVGARRFAPIADELKQLEEKRMVEALEAANGVQKRAAELIAMPYRTFVFKMKLYGLRASG